MRKTLLLQALAFICYNAQGQKIETAINGGVTAHADAGPAQRPGYYGSVRGSALLANWQIGAAMDMMETGYTKKEVKAMPGGGSELVIGSRYVYSYAAPNVFANRLFRTKKGYLYAGANAGWSFNSKEITTMGITTESRNDVLMLGAQAGYTVYATRHWGLNAEAAARCLRYPGGNSFLFPVSAGVRYRL
jgi:hypothetical protein